MEQMIMAKPLDPYQMVTVFKAILEDIQRGLRERNLILLVDPEGRYSIGDY